MMMLTMVMVRFATLTVMTVTGVRGATGVMMMTGTGTVSIARMVTESCRGGGAKTVATTTDVRIGAGVMERGIGRRYDSDVAYVADEWSSRE